MALRIELWTQGRLTDGMERWWDDVDAWIDADESRRARYPVTGSIDPYGFATITVRAFPVLLAELSDIEAGSPPSVAAAARELASLCTKGLGSDTAELRLVGD